MSERDFHELFSYKNVLSEDGFIEGVLRKSRRYNMLRMLLLCAAFFMGLYLVLQVDVSDLLVDTIVAGESEGVIEKLSEGFYIQMMFIGFAALSCFLISEESLG